MFRSRAETMWRSRLARWLACNTGMGWSKRLRASGKDLGSCSTERVLDPMLAEA